MSLLGHRGKLRELWNCSNLTKLGAGVDAQKCLSGRGMGACRAHVPRANPGVPDEGNEPALAPANRFLIRNGTTRWFAEEK